jgi:hypothetical protein
MVWVYIQQAACAGSSSCSCFQCNTAQLGCLSDAAGAAGGCGLAVKSVVGLSAVKTPSPVSYTHPTCVLVSPWLIVVLSCCTTSCSVHWKIAHSETGALVSCGL